MISSWFPRHMTCLNLRSIQTPREGIARKPATTLQRKWALLPSSGAPTGEGGSECPSEGEREKEKERERERERERKGLRV